LINKNFGKDYAWFMFSVDQKKPLGCCYGFHARRMRRSWFWDPFGPNQRL